MLPTLASQMADEWLALRAVWDQVPPADRDAALTYFRLPEPDLTSFTREQLLAAYIAGS